MFTSTPVPAAAAAARASQRAGTSPSSCSPTRLSRLQEKEGLRHLNDRLANYIERVRQLELERSSMHLLLEEKEETSSRELSNVRQLFEAELADARKTLDVAASGRARLQIEYSTLREDHRRLAARNEKNEADLSDAVQHWRNLEAALNSKEAEFANLLAVNQRLETHVENLGGQVVNLESALQNAKAQIYSELLQRVDAENQFQTLQEQMDFQKSVMEQEVQEMRSRHESRLVEVVSGRQMEFDSKLVETIQQLRQEHEAQIQQYKEDLERTFSAKLENAKQVAVKNSSLPTSAAEELAEAKLQVNSLSTQISNLHKQKSTLEARVQDLEHLLDHEQQLSHQRLMKKEQEMDDMREQLQTKLEEYQSLLDVKLMLDLEINAYRKMLEGEEKRLKLSPSPSQHTSITHTHTQATRKVWLKKRKHEGSSGLSPSSKVSQDSSARGCVSIEHIDIQGNFIKLKNNSDMAQPLGGWIVRRKQTSVPDVSFQIPTACVLDAGEILTIWSAGAGVEPNPPTDLVLSGPKTWGVVSDVRVSLINTHNEEMAERTVVCARGQGEGDSDVEFDKDSGVGPEMYLCRQGEMGIPETSCMVM